MEHAINHLLGFKTFLKWLFQTNNPTTNNRTQAHMTLCPNFSENFKKK
jgi:hypothetical protein